MSQKNTESTGGRRWKGGWLFLVVVMLMYGISAAIDSDLTQKAVDSFIQMFDNIVPALVLVFVLMFITDLFLNPKRVEKYLGKQSGLKGWFIAIGIGILSAGPIYAWYAILADLKHRGMKKSLMATFLYSRAVKLPLLPLMIHYFGIGYTLLLYLYLIGFAVVSGIVIQRLEDKGFMSD